MKSKNLVPWAAALVALSLAACNDPPKPEGSPPPQASASAAPSASASAAAAEPAAPWYVGTWTGTYDAQHYLIEMTKQQGTVPAWAKDDGKVGAGQGKLDLSVDADGRVTGSASGPLGDLVASGEVDGDALRVQLSPRDPTAQEAKDSFAGTLIAARKGEAIEGRLQASTGDSHTVRDAPVKLQKAPQK